MNTRNDCKILISVKEASHVYGIGEHTIRKILNSDYECRYHLMIGRVIRIKREAFEDYINHAEMI